MCVCPKCKGGGWIIVKKSTPHTKEVYQSDVLIEFAEPCPDCNGGEAQRVADIRERLQGTVHRHHRWRQPDAA